MESGNEGIRDVGFVIPSAVFRTVPIQKESVKLTAVKPY